jgi:MOSC domain-containing protein YiiM
MGGMTDGYVFSIHISRAEGGDIQSMREAELIAGEGIRGDRYFQKTGGDPARELTLVELEQIERFNRDSGLQLDPAATRRNIVTKGVALNDLVGKHFRVGRALVLGVDLCEPCKYLGDLLAGDLSSQEIIEQFVHRAGLRARILEGAVVQVGDPIFLSHQLE